MAHGSISLNGRVGNEVLAQAVGGGEVSPIPTPFTNAAISDISPDNFHLLVKQFLGT